MRVSALRAPLKSLDSRATRVDYPEQQSPGHQTNKQITVAPRSGRKNPPEGVQSYTIPGYDRPIDREFQHTTTRYDIRKNPINVLGGHTSWHIRPRIVVITPSLVQSVGSDNLSVTCLTQQP